MSNQQHTCGLHMMVCFGYFVWFISHFGFAYSAKQSCRTVCFMAGDGLMNQASCKDAKIRLVDSFKLFIAYQYSSFKAFLLQLLLVTSSGIPG